MTKPEQVEFNDDMVGRPTITQAVFDAKFAAADLQESHTHSENSEIDQTISGSFVDINGDGSNLPWIFLTPEYDRPAIHRNKIVKARSAASRIPTWRFEYYLQRVAHHGHQSKASKEAKISFVSINILKNFCPVFGEAFKKAYALSTSRLEDVAVEMGHAGDPQMVRFLLTKRMAGIYGDKTQIEITDARKALDDTLAPMAELTTDERASLRQLVAKASGVDS